MNRLTLAELRERGDELEVAAARTPDAADFCSGSDWLFAAHDSLHELSGKRDHFIVEGGGDWLVFVEGEHSRVWFPFESAWMFGCPLLGDPERSVDLLLAAAAEWLPRPCGFVIGGVLAGSPLHLRLRRLRPGTVHYREIPATDCMILDLDEGTEAWLGRRSRKFRRSLNSVLEVEGLEIVGFESGASAEDLLDRILAIQRETYKWRDGTDIFQIAEYAEFYRDLIDRLHRAGRLRLLFARREGRDLAYILGGVSGRTYRGLQMGYADEFRPLGLGNRLQWENLVACEREGIVRYDLGMHSSYKERWADRREERIGVYLVI